MSEILEALLGWAIIIGFIWLMVTLWRRRGQASAPSKTPPPPRVPPPPRPKPRPTNKAKPKNKAKNKAKKTSPPPVEPSASKVKQTASRSTATNGKPKRSIPTTLAIDFGTTFSAAAMTNRAGRTAPIEIDGSTEIPSSVFVEDDGTIKVGMAALNSLGANPSMAVRSPKLALGDRAETMAFGPVGTIPVTDLVAAVLERFWAEYLRLKDNEEPERVVLTHPAAWADRTVKRLGTAAAAAGFGDNVEFITEPVAVAGSIINDKSANGSRASKTLTVFDMGGGTTDIAILRSTTRALRLAGEPQGVEIGGELFDERLAGWMGERFSKQSQDFKSTYGKTDRNGLRLQTQLLDRAREAKEYLSSMPSVPTTAPMVPEQLTVTTEDLKKLIWEDLMTSVTGLQTAAAEADIDVADLGTVQLAGGSSHMPLVAEAVRLTTGTDPVITAKPKLAVCLGAARASTRLAA